METRRIRRLERRRVHRIVALACAVAALGMAVGLVLPRSTPTSVALFTLAACSLLLLAMRQGSFAPLHGLHHVVRLPLRRSISATVASFASRVAGSVRALVPRHHELTPIVLDEPDDEAEAWWGPAAASTAIDPPAPAVEPVDPLSPAPILAAPLPSAHVATNGSDSAPGRMEPGRMEPGRMEKVRAALRRHGGALARRMEPTEEAGASTGA